MADDLGEMEFDQRVTTMQDEPSSVITGGALGNALDTSSLTSCTLHSEDKCEIVSVSKPSVGSGGQHKQQRVPR